MKNLLLIIVLNLSVVFSVFSQNSEKAGNYFIKNYTPFDYNASEQNWAVTQDDRGVMYFGNNSNGIIEYDGVNWNLIEVADNPIIRILAKSPQGIIYVGAESEFGYLMPKLSGELIYKSLSADLDSLNSAFLAIFKIHFHEGITYFSSLTKIFLYRNEKLIETYKLPKYSRFSFLIDEKLYVGNLDLGLGEMKKGKFELVKNGKFFAEKQIMSILEYSDSILLISSLDRGIFLYNKKNGEILHDILKEELNIFFKNSGLYRGQQVLKDKYLFTTLDKGISVIDKKGNVLKTLVKKDGLQDNTAVASFGGVHQPLWLSLQVGLSKVELNSSFRFFSSKDSLEGIVTDVVKFNKKLYVSTLKGVFCFDTTQNAFVKNKNLFNTWAIQKLEDNLFVCSDEGISVMNKNEGFQQIKEGAYFKIHQSNISKNKFFAYGEKGVDIFYKENNKYAFQKLDSNFIQEIKNIALDKNDNVWLISSAKEIIFYKKNKTAYRQEKIDKTTLPKINSIYYDKELDELILLTQKGLFHYNSKTKKFEKYSAFSQRYVDNDFQVKTIFKDEFKQYFFVCKNKTVEWVEKISIQGNKVLIDSVSFRRLRNRELDVVYNDGKHIWIGHAKGLYRYDENIKTEKAANFNCLIREIRLNEDSIVYKGAAFEYNSELERNMLTLSTKNELNYQFNYSQNAIAFSFALPFFEEEENTEYSWRLIGYENKFTKWSKKATVNYTNLYEGEYIFEVKARNIYGFETNITKLKFAILPPWYRSIFAYLVYFVLAILFVILIVRLNSRRLVAQKEQLEKIVEQRTQEVQDQKKVLEIKNREITASINYAEKIQKAIFPPDDFLKKHFEYFIFFKPRDIVSGDFYWLDQLENKVVIVTADCTGHGVPGAFMSMLGVSSLNEIVRNSNAQNSNEILDKLRDKIKHSLHHNETEQADGMDLALYILDLDNLKIQFSGAYNPLIIIRENELIQLKGDRQPIGSHLKEKPFSMQEFQLQKNDILYTFSDGFPDQLGGDEERKYMVKNFKQFLMQINNEKLERQHQLLETELKRWMGQEEQLDDILIIGLKIGMFHK